MGSKLIKLNDGTLIEAEVNNGEAKEIASGLADKVNSSFEKIRPILTSVCKPITETWKELSKEMTIDQAEIQLGLNFEGEGNLFITKSKAGANITVKLVLKPGK
ncbi:MAG: hypothetical protein BA873_15980 [Desulfobulbaceae bacterium C00003063]|nr:MAG: hypothetical protein BA873_15980 [Desulfobulbaceae bacterium C00003063]